jgi:5'-nucleotidase
MKSSRRPVAATAAFALALAGALAGPVQTAQADDPVTIHVLTFNDFHGRINADITVRWAATLEQEALKDPDHTIVVSAGDNIGASEFASFIQDDEPTIQLLNDLAAQVRFEASAVGNHEFDQGFDDLKNRVIGGQKNGAAAPVKAAWTYLGANVIDKASGTPAFDPYYIYTLPSGLRIAVIGAVTQATSALVSPAGVANLTFTDPVEAVNLYADEITAKNLADIIIADYHEGAATASSLDAALKAAAATGEADFKRIVNETNNNVDAIITAHTHMTYAWTGLGDEDPEKLDTHQGRPVIQTGSYGANVGVIDLTYDPATKTVTAGTAKNVPAMAAPEAGSDAEKAMLAIGNIATIKQHVDAAVAQGAVLGNRVIGQTSGDITTAHTGGAWVCTAVGYTPPAADPNTCSYSQPATGAATRDDRANESSLALLVADAFLESAQDSEVIGGADIGIVNAGGGLRAELFQGSDGKITYAEANTILPFVNNIWTIKLTGAQFKNFLEEQWQTNAAGERPSRPFLATGVSSNVTYTVDTDQPSATPCTLESCGWSDPKSHITQIFINGVPLEADKLYKIVTISFLANGGGDNYWVMNQGTEAKDTGLVDRDLWIEALMELSGVAAPDAAATASITPSFARSSVVVTNLTPATAPMAKIEVTAGEKITATLSRLNLTSLGAPANKTVDTYLAPATAVRDTTGYGTKIGEAVVTMPNDTAGCTAAGVSADLNPASTGCAKLDVTVPADTAAGDYILTSIVKPSNTIIQWAVHVSAATPTPTPTPTATPSATPSATPTATPTASTSGTGTPSGTLAGTGTQANADTVRFAWVATLVGLALILIAFQRRREAKHGV